MTTIQENILDVTTLEPKMKHPTIFVRFDELEAGESLTIHNDHDPKPLYYQLLAERGNVFTWEYLEEGPVWWKVRISKRNINEKQETLGEIAAKDLRKVQVFKKYGLDFCCGGKNTIQEACAKKGLDVTKIEKELQQIDSLATLNIKPLPFNDWKLDFLADYIVNTHHSYVTKLLPDLLFYANKVARVHGDRHPELIQINELVVKLNDEMLSHMVKEERVLFPYIKELVQATQQPHQSAFGTVKNPINMMEMEHEIVGEIFEKIRTLTNDYTLPVDACASYGVLYRLLSEFEDDTHTHIHLENNILFPKAIELENSNS